MEALGTAGRATASRGGALPVLAGIRTELVGDVLTLTGHDLELTIAVTISEGVKGNEDGVAVLPSRLVSDVVRSLRARDGTSTDWPSASTLCPGRSRTASR